MDCEQKLTFERVGEVIKSQGRSQKWVAEQTGTHKSFVNRLCNGKVDGMTLDTAFKLSVVVDMGLDDLFVENVEE